MYRSIFLTARAARLVIPLYLALAATPLMADIIANSNCLPPANTEYAGQFIAWGPVTLTNSLIAAFTACTAVATTVGAQTIATFSSLLTGELFLNSIDQGPVSGIGQTTVMLTVASNSGGVETLNSHLTQLDVQLQNGALVRVDPTTPSTGETTITDVGGGEFRITSFFDIFTDLSIDGGATWIPGVGPGPGGSTVVTLQGAPEPGTVLTLGSGLALLCATTSRSRGRTRRS